MNCDQVIRGELAEPYLRGELSEADQEAFERHYFECARCFDEVETYRALQHVLKEADHLPLAVPAVGGAFSGWKWVAAAASVVLVIALSSLLSRRPAPLEVPAASPSAVATRPPEVTPTVPPPPETTPTAPASNLPSLTELAQVLPPGYRPAVMRGASDDAARRFREAMQRYVKGDYAGALGGLQAAARDNADAPDIAFFLGICSLLTGDTAAATGQLRRTIQLGESPYLEEAHFYLAKAHLRRAELQAASAELAKTIQLRGDREKEARQLLQKVEVLRKR